MMKISDLIEDYTLPKWEDYPEVPGFRVLIRLPDAPKMFSLAMRALREEQREGGQVEGEMPVYIGPEMVRYAVSDWQGLTVAGLKILVPGRKIKGRDEQDIPYSAENLVSLLRMSGAFYLWALSKLQEREAAARQEAEEIENLSDTPSTTPTPTP